MCLGSAQSDLPQHLLENCGCTGNVKVVLLCDSPHTNEIEAFPRRLVVRGMSG